MPLPDNGAPWPPKSAQAPLAAMAEWSAWYSGDPDELANYYSTVGVRTRTSSTRPRDGIRGMLTRWWWGTPSSENESRAKLHVPLPGDIAATSADLLFAEAPTLSAADDRNTKLQAALDEFAGDGLQSQLHEAAEVAAALGGVYLRTVWDRDVAPMPWLDAVHADAAIPEFRWGKLMAVTFWRRLDDGHGSAYRLLERHEPGRVLHGLYEGSDDNLGRLVPLVEHPDAAHLAAIVDADGAVETGTDLLTVSYIPNMLPNRAIRGCHLGGSDYQGGVTGIFDALDEAFSSWHRDIRLAKARLIVPEGWLQTDGPGSSALFDTDRELLVGARMLDKGDRTAEQSVVAQQFAIRYEDHAKTCQDWSNMAVRAAGYSAQTFGDSGDVAMTATEATARERKSYNTRGKKILYWRPGLVEQLQAWAEVANAQCGAGIELGDIKVDWPDGVRDSQLSLAQTAQALKAAEAASTETLVRMVNPDWDKDQVDAEVAAIIAERPTMPSPLDAGV